ncbi:dynein light chain-related protein [Apiospora arundinis]
MSDALHRLSKKPGVKAWIMLDRTSGAVIKTNGQIAAIRPARSANSTTNPTTSLPTPTGGSSPPKSHNETQAAQELGSMVWGFLSTAGSLVQEMDTEDELKLLRLRTKKQELVIVPELKYILVVIHDTPPA